MSNAPPTLLDPELARQVRWRVAAEQLPVAKIANMATRIARYQQEVRSFWRGEYLMLAVVAAAVVFPGTYGLLWLTGAGARLVHWWVPAIGIWLTIQVPAVGAMHPRRPTEDDIRRDQAMRRQVGMDDAVED